MGKGCVGHWNYKYKVRRSLWAWVVGHCGFTEYRVCKSLECRSLAYKMRKSLGCRSLGVQGL